MASAAPPISLNGEPPSQALPQRRADSSHGPTQNGTTPNGTANGDAATGAVNGKPDFIYAVPENYHASNVMRLAEHPIENFRPLRVICIGAGYSGIYMGIRIPELLRNVSLTVYEKNTGLGGTWWENRYPGCACDIPAHSYVYTFEPNREWSEFYAGSTEIQNYLEGVAKKYSADRFVKLHHKVLKCEWDHQRGVWKVDVEKTETGEVIHDEAEFIVSARGGLNDYVWPEIEGLNTFEGKLLHSATWDTSYDYSNKKVGVIGNGSSAIQIVPNMQKVPGVDLKCFMRSRTWIAQSFGEMAMQKLHFDHLTFTDEDRDQFMDTEEKYHHFRKTIETEGNAVHNVSQRGSAFAEGARQMFTDLMKTRLAKRPELAEFLIPQFAVGCRRLTPGPGFLESLCEDNVEVIKTPIEKITPKGVQMSDGRHVDLDVLVCATGFNACAAPPFTVIGMDGLTLEERFKPYPEAYLSLTTDKFPNYMMMLGPNAGVGSGSLTKIIEAIGDYIIKCIRKIQKEDIKAMHLKPARMKDWSAYVDAYFPRTVYLDQCKSWYRNDKGRGTRIIGLWPGSTLHAVELLRSPRWEDYEYEYDEPEDDPIKANRLRWLGNGWSEIQLRDGGDMSYYIEDAYIDFPSAPLPEKTPKWNQVSFSY